MGNGDGVRSMSHGARSSYVITIINNSHVLDMSLLLLMTYNKHRNEASWMIYAHVMQSLRCELLFLIVLRAILE